jgi:hypothetical protein
VKILHLINMEIGPEFTQPLSEMNTRNKIIKFLGSKVRPVCMDDSLAAICEPIV